MFRLVFAGFFLSLVLASCGGRGIALRPVAPDDRIERYQIATTAEGVSELVAEGGSVPGDSDIIGGSLSSSVAEAPELSAAPPAPPELRSQAHRAHRVRKGETLSSIARLYGVPSRQIMTLSGLSNPNRIYIGMSLTIPGGQRSGRSEGSVRHVVRRGDTLYAIADQYRTTVSALKRTNRIRDARALSLGQVLIIPSTSKRSAKTESTKGIKLGSSADQQQKVAKAQRSSKKAKEKESQAKRKIVRLSAAPQREKKTFLRPVKGKIVSKFGEKKFGQRNNGIDILGREGSAVKAAENGVVVYSGSAVDGFGNLILLRHADGYLTAYGYNRKNLVARGDRVRRGQTIAELGQSGDIDRPTLHFELRRKSRPTDPQPNFTR